ncbi:MAG: hypothetical protein EBV20_05780 [Betaproteobacteria bacterium]|jgi:hypothetical protein|nr:hypothetical protein [Betaproteobacteria bacterium]NBP45674.1 hypothetical protein [Betaproteobacteria bacterium]
MTSTFKLSRAAMWAGLITASLGLNAWAGRPLDVDDAGVNAKGHGHVELWQTRAGDGSRNWTIAPAFAPIDGFEVAYVRNTDNSSQDVAQTLQLKGLITPSKEDGCNQAATYGITRRNHALAGARYGWLINTCNQSWGSWHTNLGASHDFSTASKPLLAMALEFSGFSFVPHVQWISQQGTMPSFGAGIRKALSDQWQIDASASRQGGQSIWTLGTKFSF